MSDDHSRTTELAAYLFGRWDRAFREQTLYARWGPAAAELAASGLLKPARDGAIVRCAECFAHPAGALDWDADRRAVRYWCPEVVGWVYPGPNERRMIRLNASMLVGQLATDLTRERDEPRFLTEASFWVLGRAMLKRALRPVLLAHVASDIGALKRLLEGLEVSAPKAAGCLIATSRAIVGMRLPHGYAVVPFHDCVRFLGGRMSLDQAELGRLAGYSDGARGGRRRGKGPNASLTILRDRDGAGLTADTLEAEAEAIAKKREESGDQIAPGTIENHIRIEYRAINARRRTTDHDPRSGA